MTNEDLVLTHPPATEVQISISFPNNLDVADQRGKFYTLVRAEFPIILMPEQSKMAFDLSDYTLQSQDTGDRLEIGMNYFRLVSVRYPGFRKFRELFIEALNLFLKCYKIDSFSVLAMSYRNQLPLESNQKYKNVFALNISLPKGEEPELFAGQGVLVFQQPEGFVTLQLEPRAEGLQVKSYAMNLLFTTRADSGLNDKTLIPDFLDVAHQRLRQFFFRILTTDYMEYLKSR